MLKKTVYIAEKPDIGRAVAAYLWPDGGMEKGERLFSERGYCRYMGIRAYPWHGNARAVRRRI